MTEQESEGPQDWIKDYVSKDVELDAVWNRSHAMRNGMIVPIPSNLDAFQTGNIHYNIPQPAFVEQQSAKDLLDDAKWANEFSSNKDETSLLEKTELMATAKEFLKSVSDPKIKATEFMGFVEKLSTGEIGADGKKAETRSADWVSEFERNLTENRGDLNWADEFVSGEGAVGGVQSTEGKEEFWQQLTDEWEKLAAEDTISHPWLSKAVDKLYEVRQL